MSQTPHSPDQYGNEPGSPASEPFANAADGAPRPDPVQEQGSATSDPALHPHDPYASSAPAPQHPAAQQPSHAAQQPSYAAPAAAGAGVGAGQAQYGAPHAAPGGELPDQPAPGTPGVFEGALPGQPMSRSDSRLWAMFSQLAVVIGHLVSWGFLGWIGPLVIFLIYKDRDRFVRFHAAEALNGAIAVFIASVVLSIAIGIFGIVTLSIGWALFPLVGVPALLQLVFAIIGAVKANQGEYWAYPVNIRLVK